MTGVQTCALPIYEIFMVMYGDSYLPIDYASFARAFAQGGFPAMMSVYRNQGRWDHSNTRVEDGRVVYYDKKAPFGTADCIDYGLTVFQKKVIESYKTRSLPLDMAVILQDLVTGHQLAAWEAPRRFYEIGKPEGLRELEAHLLKASHAEP